MSAHGTRYRSFCGHGKGRKGALAESSSLGNMPNLGTSETPISPATETGSQSRLAGDDALSQAMLRVLEKLVGPHSGSRGHGPVTEPLWSNGAELFRGVTGVAPTVAEYWLEATKRIMNDINCTPKQKLSSLFASQRGISVRKYVRASCVDACRREFMNLTQGDKSVVEYEAEFLRLSRYDRGMMVSEYEKCVRFENGLRDYLMVLVAPQWEKKFAVLVDKVKFVEEV
ncbi:uncharacterized protein LOC105795880 [Gossypium raimondii]|uniref:uncharacterized protein LOC105795880 n=1 Tax=Gossypium raimondii TaxID=29730 RepID=UPI00063AADAF|nr:uncharacterized protein LOC105795880 [Gossypium raimondii]